MEIAQIYEVKQDHRIAKQYYENAVSICENANIRYLVYARSYEGLANIFYAERDFSKAFECYQKCLPIFQKF